MLKINIVKNQHYVSRGILKHFSDKDKKVYELFISKKIVSRKAIDNTMSQKFVYEHTDLEKNLIENLFSGFESKVFPIIDDLINRLEEDYGDGKDIEKYKKTIYNIMPIVLLFYFRSGALLKEYSMNAENPKDTRVERMLLNIVDWDYLRGLNNTICKHYECSIIVDEKGRFLLSDQYISTVALKYKNNFSNSSNRQIGMKETMLLLPLSSKFYIVFFNGNNPYYVKNNYFSVLDDISVQQINNVIFKNSYVKCVSKDVKELERLKNSFSCSSPVKTIMLYKDGYIEDFINKKEVFLYEKDLDIKENFIKYIAIYNEKIKNKMSRNDPCVCGSMKKFKKCCIDKYEAIAEIITAIKNPSIVNYTIDGVTTVEKNIVEYKGIQENLSNQHDKEMLEQLQKLCNKNDIT